MDGQRTSADCVVGLATMEDAARAAAWAGLCASEISKPCAGGFMNSDGVYWAESESGLAVTVLCVPCTEKGRPGSLCATPAGRFVVKSQARLDARVVLTYLDIRVLEDLGGWEDLDHAGLVQALVQEGCEDVAAWSDAFGSTLTADDFESAVLAACCDNKAKAVARNKCSCTAAPPPPPPAAAAAPPKKRRRVGAGGGQQPSAVMARAREWANAGREGPELAR